MPESLSRPRAAFLATHAVALARSERERRLLGFWLLLGVARAAILLLPDRLVVRRFGAAGHLDDVTRTSDRELDASQIGHLVTRAALHTPWKSECYPRALVASYALRRAGIPHLVSLGVRRAETLEAHAWVEVGHVGVVGTEVAADYVVVGRFPWPVRCDAAA